MLRNFARFPTAWVRSGGLSAFTPVEVWALKALFGLAILRGRYERGREASADWFPASLKDLAEAAHLSRNDAHAGLRFTVDRGIVEQAPNMGAHLGVHRRTSGFRFAGPPEPFFAFPHFHVAQSDFLGQLRRGQAALAALKIYLLLGTFRNIRTGMTWLSYDRMAEYSVRRTYARAGLSLLYGAGLVSAYPPTDAVPFWQYYVNGLGRTPPMGAAMARAEVALGLGDAF
jgi:hypothetical protein